MPCGSSNNGGWPGCGRLSSPLYGELWGRLVESAAGAHLYNTRPPGTDVQYWRERNHEVDFVIRQGTKVAAVEIKSGRNKGVLTGLNAFVSSFSGTAAMTVGTGGIPLETFLSTPMESWIR
jgi:hypothetical protein